MPLPSSCLFVFSPPFCYAANFFHASSGRRDAAAPFAGDWRPARGRQHLAGTVLLPPIRVVARVYMRICMRLHGYSGMVLLPPIRAFACLHAHCVRRHRLRTRILLRACVYNLKQDKLQQVPTLELGLQVQHSMFAKLGAIIETTQVCLSPSHPIAAVYGACRATYGAFNVIYGSCGAIYG